MSDTGPHASLQRENERLRRALAQATKGQIVAGSGRKVEARPLDSVVTFRVDADTLRALLDLTEAFGTSRGEVVREAIRRMSNSHRQTPYTPGAWGHLVLAPLRKAGSA